MATRMTTLAYIEKEPFTYGNRPDAAIDPGASGEHPRLLPTIEMRAYEPPAAAANEPFPLAPSVAASIRPPAPVMPVALPSIVLALATAAAVLVGLALVGIVIAFAATLSAAAYVVLLGSAVYLLGVGITALIASPTFRFS